eukprot:scaffold8049_cov78-Cyclotella_meneghiniana.AAC.3
MYAAKTDMNNQREQEVTMLYKVYTNGQVMKWQNIEKTFPEVAGQCQLAGKRLVCNRGGMVVVVEVLECSDERVPLVKR